MFLRPLMCLFTRSLSVWLSGLFHERSGRGSRLNRLQVDGLSSAWPLHLINTNEANCCWYVSFIDNKSSAHCWVIKPVTTLITQSILNPVVVSPGALLFPTMQLVFRNDRRVSFIAILVFQSRVAGNVFPLIRMHAHWPPMVPHYSPDECLPFAFRPRSFHPLHEQCYAMADT